MLIRSLTLGNKTFPNNLIQGPLAGTSTAPFRALTWEWSQPAFSCTEMISCKTLLRSPIESQHRFIAKDPNEGPVCFQLSGNDPQDLAEATKIVTDYGADLINLNCGCPVKKIRSKGAGSHLLSDASKLYQLITAMKQNTFVPVSIKIRVDGKSTDNFNHDVVKAVQDAGTDFLVVHGRHWTEHYETPCHYDQVRFFVDALSIPVIGNGDIACAQSLQKMFATGCAGVMVARAGVGQPWLIAKLMAELQQQAFVMPSHAQIGAMFIQHVTALGDLLKNEKFAIIEARKYAKYYARGLSQRAAFTEVMNRCEKLSDLTTLVQQYFI